MAEGVVKSRRWRYGDDTAGEASRGPLAGIGCFRQFRQGQQAAPDTRWWTGFEQDAALVAQHQQRRLASRDRLARLRLRQLAGAAGGERDADFIERAGL